MTTRSENIDYNHWILRIVAFIVDSILVFIVAYLIQSVITIALVISFHSFASFYSVLLVFLGVLSVIYFTILDNLWGGTIGKRVFGLHVQMTNGNKVPIDKALIRNITKIFFVIVLIDWIVALVTPGPDRRQKYTDRIAGTTVVQTKQPLTIATTQQPQPPPPT